MKPRRSGPLKDDCAQHRCQRSECPPGSAHGHTHRFRDEIYGRAETAADAQRATVIAWLEQAMEALNGGVRCRRCDRRDPAAPPVPVIWGDLTGKTLAEGIAEAMEAAVSQHPQHGPVAVGRALLIRADATCARCDAPWSADHACDADHQTVTPARAKKGRVRT